MVQLVTVESRDVRMATFESVMELVRGQSGSSARLAFERAGVARVDGESEVVGTADGRDAEEEAAAEEEEAPSAAASAAVLLRAKRPLMRSEPRMAARLLAEAITAQAGSGFDIFAKVPHMAFPGGQRFRAPLLAMGMLWERTKELF